MIYLDSAALVKLVRQERESAGLAIWLATRLAEPRVSSTLAEVEVPRALRRVDMREPETEERVMNSVLRLDLDGKVRTSAATLAPPGLRSLHAIHLATALMFAGEIKAFVSYDKRLLDAARAAGLPVASPGA